jgi:hypothetical protein
VINEAKEALKEIAEDARLKAEILEEEQEDKEDLDQDFYYNAGQIEAYNAIANILEKIIKEN